MGYALVGHAFSEAKRVHVYGKRTSSEPATLEVFDSGGVVPLSDRASTKVGSFQGRGGLGL